MPSPAPDAPRVSKRSESIRPFLAMEVMERAFAMERQGIDVVHFEIGEPDFPPPEAAIDACERALRGGETHYSDSRGLTELREAIARDTHRRFGVEVDPGRVLVTSGTSPAMLLVFSLLLEPGDEVIMGAPYYPCYPNFVRFCGGEPVLIAMDPAQGYPLDPDAVRAAITPRTRAVMVASPANPTGAIQSRDTLEGLAGLGVPIISDEIYDGIVYDGARVTSALEVTDEPFVLDGFSKRYAMTGFRLGYVIAPEWAMRRLQVMQQSLFISANRFVQHAGLGALESGEETVSEMRRVYDRRRHLLADGLRSLGFGIPELPPGAFYIFADARHLDSDSLRLASRILEQAHVGVTPGIDFGEAGEGRLRFCYAVADDTIERGLERLADVMPLLEADAGENAEVGAEVGAEADAEEGP